MSSKQKTGTRTRSARGFGPWIALGALVVACGAREALLLESFTRSDEPADAASNSGGQDPDAGEPSGSGARGGRVPVPQPQGGTSSAGGPSSGTAGAVGIGGAAVVCQDPPGASAQRAVTRFAVIGDFGRAGPDEEQVADLVKSWRPDFIVTTGDNNYPNGAADTMDANVGAYFREFICPYLGAHGPGSQTNRFFPSLGNHDWYTPGAQPYLDYFTLPGNERYYDVVWNHVHLFALDSDPNEPDGLAFDSTQGRWLEERLANSRTRWQVVYLHHPPYSSARHGSSILLRWPFTQWGADLVIAGHDHVYERLEVDGIPYVVNGLGGNSRYDFGAPLEGSQVRFNTGFGAQLVEADATRLVSRFFTVERELIDERVVSD